MIGKPEISTDTFESSSLQSSTPWDTSPAFQAADDAAGQGLARGHPGSPPLMPVATVMMNDSPWLYHDVMARSSHQLCKGHGRYDNILLIVLYHISEGCYQNNYG